MAQNEITYFPIYDSGLIIGRVADFAAIAGGYSGKGTLPRECWYLVVDTEGVTRTGVSIVMWMPDRYQEDWETASAGIPLRGWRQERCPGGTSYWNSSIAMMDAPIIVRRIVRALFSEVARREREERERKEAEARFCVNSAQRNAFAGVNWEDNEAMTTFRDLWRQHDDWSFG